MCIRIANETNYIWKEYIWLSTIYYVNSKVIIVVVFYFRNQRSLSDPSTPDPYEKISKRRFEGKVSKIVCFNSRYENGDVNYILLIRKMKKN